MLGFGMESARARSAGKGLASTIHKMKRRFASSSSFELFGSLRSSVARLKRFCGRSTRRGRTIMAPNQRAVENHEELFPNHVSTLAVTDPELIETFDNFAFDEVLSHGNLDVRTRLMVQLAAIIACQALREYRVMLDAALTVGVTPVEAKEVLYQS